MKTDFFALYDALLDGVKSDAEITDSGSGRFWTMAQTADSIGLAMTTAGNTIAPMYPDGVNGLSLRDAALAAKSWNMEEAGFGLAAANAYYNTEKRIRELDSYEPFENYCTRGLDFSGKTVGLIGHLKGPEGLRKVAKRVFILERAPQEGDYPDSACDLLLPQCDVVIITGSSLVNKTLPHLLDLCENACTIITGPSVPMCPALLDFGIDRVAGMAVADRDTAKHHALNSISGTPYRFGIPFLLKK